MNKDNIIKWIDEEIKREKSVLGNDCCFVGEVKGTLLGRIQEAERIKEYIQSEPEETKPIDIEGVKTNFDMITESPKKLAEFILEQYGYSPIKDYGTYFNLGQWLNEKAGE
jgi:hypothetical protein